MTWHPLRLFSLLALAGLIGSQLGLVVWLETELRYLIAALLIFPLLLPLRGFINNSHYTFKWTGFLTLLYFGIGVSEAFVNPEHRLYSSLTLLFSCLLFFTSIYYSRYLRVSQDQAD